MGVLVNLGIGGLGGSKPEPEPTVSRAVIANGRSNGNGCVVWWTGTHLHYEIHEAGLSDLSDLGLDDAPHGISVWEGYYHYTQDFSPEGVNEGGEAIPHGVFRAPTAEEWAAIHENRTPWPEATEESETP